MSPFAEPSVPLYPLDEARRNYLAYEAAKSKKRREPDPSLRRDLERGWMVPMLLELDTLLYGRWDYWARVHLLGELPCDPIPRLEFLSCPGPNSRQMGMGPGRTMLERCLEGISLSWRGWSSWQHMNYFLDWLLFAFGCQDVELPDEPGGSEGASMRLYQLFDLWPLLLWPYDHFADMLAESRHGRQNGFYPTPHCLVEMMCMMTMQGQDCRAQTVNDPACGSSRMLLHASNHSLRLFGTDIDGTLCKVSRVNGFLYAPWLAKSFEWEGDQIVQSELARDWARVLRLEAFLRDCFVREEPEEPLRAPPDDVPRQGALFEVESEAPTQAKPKTASRTRNPRLTSAVTTQLLLEF